MNWWKWVFLVEAANNLKVKLVCRLRSALWKECHNFLTDKVYHAPIMKSWPRFHQDFHPRLWVALMRSLQKALGNPCGPDADTWYCPSLAQMRTPIISPHRGLLSDTSHEWIILVLWYVNICQPNNWWQGVQREVADVSIRWRSIHLSSTGIGWPWRVSQCREDCLQIMTMAFVASGRKIPNSTSLCYGYMDRWGEPDG